MQRYGLGIMVVWWTLLGMALASEQPLDRLEGSLAPLRRTECLPLRIVDRHIVVDSTMSTGVPGAYLRALPTTF